ncbi:MAG: ABC transporter ATP-binding protein [Granulosicoccaceae bacterium]
MINRLLIRLFSGLFDPYQAADGPPPNTLRAFYRWALRGAGGVILAQALVSSLVALAEVGSAWLIGMVVDRAGSVPPEKFFEQQSGLLLAALVLFLLVRPLLMSVQAGLNSLSLMPGLYHLSLWRLNRYTLGQSLGFFNNDFAGRLAQKQNQTASAVGSVVSEVLNAITFALALTLGAVAALGQADWRLGLVLLLWVSLYLGVLRWMLPQVRAFARKTAGANAALTGQLVDTFGNMATVKLFAHGERELAAAEQHFALWRKAVLRMGVTSLKLRMVLSVLAGVLPTSLIGLALWLWSTGQAPTGVVVVAALLSSRLAAISGWFSFMLMGLFSNVGNSEDGMETLAVPYDIQDAAEAREPQNTRGELHFKHVHYHYDRSDGAGLSGFDLHIRAGEKIALVGPSGAGKSTAVNSLLRLFDVQSGAVELDGVDIRQLTQDGLRRQIATVSQDTALFNRSVRDIIIYGKPDASEAELHNAARRAEALEFIAALQDGEGRKSFDAHLGERGVKLSGGQRQRIALARALLKDAPILLLDEATSAMDSEIEAAIQSTLEAAVAGKTVIAIAHRLSTIARMDRIVVMQDGQVAEQGSHEQLLASDGLYARLWKHQSGGFIGLE